MTDTFALTYQEILALSEAGNLAPSGGNAQPWRVVFHSTALQIYVDEKRSQSFLDAGKYASFFAIGCFVENISQMALELHLVFNIVRHEFKSVGQPLVEFTFTSRSARKKSNLSKVIPLRCTNRQLSNGQILAPSQIELLSKIAHQETGYALHTAHTFSQKEAIATQLGKADGIRYLHPDLFKEMMDEFRFSQAQVTKTKDGLDIETLEMPKHAPDMMELLASKPELRFKIPKEAFQTFAKPLLMESSHLACLSFSGSMTSSEMTKAGQVLERIWLAATAAGLAFQPWSILTFLSIRMTNFHGAGFNVEQKKELLQVTKNVKKLFGLRPKDTIVFIFRLSKAKPPSARSLRRPWQDYTTISFNAMM